MELLAGRPSSYSEKERRYRACSNWDELGYAAGKDKNISWVSAATFCSYWQYGRHSHGHQCINQALLLTVTQGPPPPAPCLGNPFLRWRQGYRNKLTVSHIREALCLMVTLPLLPTLHWEKQAIQPSMPSIMWDFTILHTNIQKE